MIRKIVNKWKDKQKKKEFKLKWKNKNRYNFISIETIPKYDLNILSKVKIGNYSYGSIIVYHWGHQDESLSIGSFCSIADGVKFVLGGNHFLDTLSTYPFKVMLEKKKTEAWTKGQIVIEDDVWIGLDVVILSGVTIGKGSVIGAGSVVAKDIPPYSIVVGNPATIVKKRFSEEIISKLNEISINEIKEEKLLENIELLYKKLNQDNINDIIRELT
ncbi:CatB-related O-acetyltransferase [Pseudofrancisella aestuarii]|uniref:CatB-related O-acetyltransferase n=1 Tax=Pseudofrancisella aestuarii TaxID=2670347 RepID=A0ABV9TAE2_9GAMM|nr:CatB-related O-acetyltransferase [Pseudofrancisella aestuarii]